MWNNSVFEVEVICLEDKLLSINDLYDFKAIQSESILILMSCE